MTKSFMLELSLVFNLSHFCLYLILHSFNIRKSGETSLLIEMHALLYKIVDLEFELILALLFSNSHSFLLLSKLKFTFYNFFCFLFH